MVKLKHKFFKISTICLILFIFLFIYFDNREERIFFNENYVLLGGSESNDNVCHLPINVNPFDESISKFIKDLPKSIECKYQSDPKNNLTFIDSSGILRQTYRYFRCKYQFFDRVENDDNLIDYKKYLELDPINGISMNGNSYVGVECTDIASNKIYRNTHFWIPLTKNSEINEKDMNAIYNKPSVLILVIESLSRLNYLRFMPRTQTSLENFGQMVYMKGLTKLADNTLPNMVPLLTGKRVWNNELLNEDFGPYDDWPFIWKDFSKAGYKTALIEDFPSFSVFNIKSKGFLRKPTDWYPRPFWIHLFRDVSKILLDLMPFELSNCYNDRYSKIDIFLQQIQHFINRTQTQDYPYFVFALSTGVTHNDFNRAQQIDSHVSKFLEESRHQLNNTILILMGDHGNRFGPVLQTLIGRIEERMPLFAIRLPDKLNQQFPNLLSNLELNSQRLTTWLDLYHILKDITNQNYSNIDSMREDLSSYSPWRQSIPHSRTCMSASIPENYCVCNKRNVLNISQPMISMASLALIKHINNFMPQNKCHKLYLKSSLSAEAILPSSSTAKPQGFGSRIEVTVSVRPSDAIFRAQLFRTARSQDWTVKGEINRINKYGNQSNCVHERRLKPFCYCLSII